MNKITTQTTRLEITKAELAEIIKKHFGFDGSVSVDDYTEYRADDWEGRFGPDFAGIKVVVTKEISE